MSLCPVLHANNLFCFPEGRSQPLDRVEPEDFILLDNLDAIAWRKGGVSPLLLLPHLTCWNDRFFHVAQTPFLRLFSLVLPLRFLTFYCSLFLPQFVIYFIFVLFSSS